tara:strand:+ start:19236 stop:20057 length:822 start_codon:yes stop_codon:yes gene_type:complete
MSLYDLKSRNYLITGGAGLLGYQHARGILQNNGNPILLDISDSMLSKTKKKLEDEYSSEVRTYLCDITIENNVQNLYEYFLTNNFQIHGLINNAAINPKVNSTIKSDELTRLESFPLNQWNDELDVGLTGSFLCSKYFCSLMLKTNSQGVVLNISSDLGIIAPNQSLYEINGLKKNEQPVKPITYSVIKSGIIGLSKYLSTYFNGEIRSNVICPGGVENNQNKDFIEKVEKLIPYGRMAKKDEFIGTVVFLLSDASAYINGAVIPVDGGRTAW